MYICPICGHRNERETSCPTCGVILVEESLSPAAETIRVEIVEGGVEEEFFEEEKALPVSEHFKPKPRTSSSSSSSTKTSGESSLSVSPPSPAESPDVSWVLVIRHRKEVLQEIPLRNELVVGRFSNETGPVDVDLSSLPGSEYVSRRHMRIFVQNGHVMVEDLGSTNGVYVNKVRITQPTPITPEDKIRIGILVFRIAPSS